MWKELEGMKRKLILFSLFFALFLIMSLLNGCGAPVDDEKPVSKALNVEDYFPIKDNVKYVYEGMGNEYAQYDVYIEYTAQGLVQQLSLIHISEPTRLGMISYAVFCLKKKKKNHKKLLYYSNFSFFVFFFNDTATTEIYTILFVGSVRCV